MENVYDNFTEVGGQDEHSLDPSMLIARAVIIRRRGKSPYQQSVLCHRAGKRPRGRVPQRRLSVKFSWGNAKALQYMRVAETERHSHPCLYFYPRILSHRGLSRRGPADSARNIYGNTDLRVPIVAVISEGGSGGAEAIGLADKRLMLPHGYYSVISPEGAAAIEAMSRGGNRATPELIEHCAQNLHFHITAQDNLRFGYIDRASCRSRRLGPGFVAF